ncbi:MAG: hypothetical protein IJR14_03965 [Synergistaceae bacterium]|nr:hypothetical protein [Synergistaceae bacterium]
MLDKTFVSTMPLEERKRIFRKAKELESQGLMEEGDRLMMTIPIRPELADGFKKLIGMERLRAIGFNFADAVKMYGEEWLNG